MKKPHKFFLFAAALLAFAAISFLLWPLEPRNPDSLRHAKLPETRFSSQSPSSQATPAPHQIPQNPFPPSLPKLASRNPKSFDLVNGWGEEIQWSSSTPAAKRANKVSLNETLLAGMDTLQPGDKLSIALFDGVSYPSVVSKVQTWNNGTVAVDAVVPGNPRSRIYLACTNGVVRVLVKDPIAHTAYQIRHDPEGGYHFVLEIDEAASDEAPCANETLPTLPQKNPPIHSAATPPLAYGDSSTLTPIPVIPKIPEAAGAEISSVVTVNLLAVYTPAALAYEGSLENIANNISLAVQMGNSALANSQTLLQINLVHTAQTTYTESGSGSTDLDRLTDTSDGFMDEVHTLRNTYAADFVSLFADVNYGGLGWMPDDYKSPTLAFNSVRVRQTDWTLTMIHEMGHNMGNGHSASQALQPGPGDIYQNSSSGNFAAGWQFVDADAAPKTGYCTVMTYEDSNNNGSEEYERIEYFSNPNVSYSGNPTGNAATADAARVIRNGRFAFANYRGAYLAPTGSITSFPYTNSFEDYLGSWFQTDDDDMDWTGLCYGDTLQSPTGPSMGAQNGDFYLAVIAYDGTAHYNKTASLVADVNLTGYVGSAFTFYYHMYDGGFSHMGSLYCDVSTTGGAPWTTLWSISGNQGDIWKQATIDLSAYKNTTIRLRIRALTGPNFLSDICLDNLNITTAMLFSSWISANYPALSDRASTADPDGDGVNNFLEYALGMDLATADAGDLPSCSLNAEGTALVVQFPRERATVRYIVQSTTDVSDWTSATTEWDSATTPPGLVAVGAVQSVTVSIGSNPKLFLRVKAEE